MGSTEAVPWPILEKSESVSDVIFDIREAGAALEPVELELDWLDDAAGVETYLAKIMKRTMATTMPLDQMAVFMFRFRRTSESCSLD